MEIRRAGEPAKFREIAVMGASGFLGGHVCAELLSRGFMVRAVARRVEVTAWLAPFGARTVRADLRDPEALRAAFAGVDAVLSCAGLTPRQGGSAEEFHDVNVTGIENLARAAAACGVRRIVHVGTAAEQPARWFREVGAEEPMIAEGAWDLATRVTTPSYAVTKAEGERRLWALAPELGLDVTVLRPGALYGPGVARLNAAYRWASSRSFLVVPTIRFPHLHVVDTARTIVDALENPNSIGGSYALCGEVVSPYRVLTELRARRGGGPRVTPLPVPVQIAYDDHPARRDLGFYSRPITDGLDDLFAAWTPPVPGLRASTSS